MKKKGIWKRAGALLLAIAVWSLSLPVLAASWPAEETVLWNPESGEHRFLDGEGRELPSGHLCDEACRTGLPSPDEGKNLTAGTYRAEADASLIYEAFPDAWLLAASREAEVTQETLYACKWVEEYDSRYHWEACDNHRESGVYNGVRHESGGVRSKAPHLLSVISEPSCDKSGVRKCRGCGYSEEIPAIPHDLTGDFIPVSTYGWCYQKCARGCAFGRARVQPCVYQVVTAPTTTSVGELQCVNCGGKIATGKLPDTCPAGGQHMLDGHVIQYEEHPNWISDAGDQMTCVKCGCWVVFREHLNDGICKLDYYPFVFCNAKYTPTGENKVHVELRFQKNITVTSLASVQPYSYKNWGSWNGTAGNIKAIPGEANAFQFDITRTSRFDEYGDRGAGAYVGFRIAGYTKVQYLYLNGCYYDTTPPRVTGFQATPNPAGAEWGNKATANITFEENGSGQVEYAVYQGSTLVRDWAYAEQTGSGTYAASFPLRGVYPEYTDFNIKTRDFDCRSAELVNTQQQALDNHMTYDEPLAYGSFRFKIRHVENEPPMFTWSLKDAGLVTGETEILCSVSDRHSGVRRTRLPNGLYTTASTFRYTINDSGIYEFMTEDQIGNCRTICVSVNNVTRPLSAEVSTKAVQIDTSQQATTTDGAFSIHNTSGVPVKASLSGFTCDLFTEFVPPGAYTQEQWDAMDALESRKHLQIGLADGADVIWLYPGAPAEIPLKTDETKAYNVICKSGRAFTEPVDFRVTMKAVLHKQE